MAGMSNSKSSKGRQSKTGSTTGRITSKKAKKMNHSRVEYKEPFEKTQELYKEGKGTERWASKGGGAKKPPSSSKKKTPKKRK
jgi:hypothetical protein